MSFHNVQLGAGFQWRVRAKVSNRGDDDRSASIKVLSMLRTITEAGRFAASELDVRLIAHWFEVNEGRWCQRAGAFIILKQNLKEHLVKNP